MLFQLEAEPYHVPMKALFYIWDKNHPVRVLDCCNEDVIEHNSLILFMFHMKSYD